MKCLPYRVHEEVRQRSTKHVMHTLGAYHFQPNTKGPLMWIVSFLYPLTVIVKASLIKEEPAGLPEKTII
jgi:hypothetical protein